jgi:hypothetical protein
MYIYFLFYFGVHFNLYIVNKGKNPYCYNIILGKKLMLEEHNNTTENRPLEQDGKYHYKKI